MSRTVIGLMFSLAGAIGGGVLGYFGFYWLLDHGFLALVLPGAMIGIGCGLLSRTTSNLRGLLCAVAALLFSLFLAWQVFEKEGDGSLSYFLTHLQNRKPVTLVLIGIGSLVAFWCGRGQFTGGRPANTQQVAKNDRE